MISSADWQDINTRMIAKSLQELSFEQILNARRLDAGPENTVGDYELTLASGVQYTFKAWRGLWTDLKVQTESIRRNGEVPSSAGQFFIDIQKETAMDDIILANFLEEMHNTLYADLKILKRSRGITSQELSTWSGERVQTVLKGHPKLLLNKGRIGWNAKDQDLYGPENENPVQFLWIAVLKEKTLSGFSEKLSNVDILGESFNDEELEVFLGMTQNLGISPEKYLFIPVHPWQWERYLKIQFAADFANGSLKFLGSFGDLYLPQISLRTFSNISRPTKMDIKLPMTILNTSAIRGIPGKYMAQGPALSTDLANLCKAEAELSETAVLEEKAGVSVVHSIYKQVAGAPYRYNELLGVLWRQSTQSKLENDEVALISGSLFHRDEQGQSLIGAHIRASGLTANEWLKRYFELIVLPLYHLQIKHGIGLVAHGQNVVIRLKKSIPVGLFLKDFQGDLRMSSTSTALNHDLTRLPANYLIHDLLTGHFVTVLRFVSETLQECDKIAESTFYRILGQVLKSYFDKNPELRNLPHFKDVDLLQEKFIRVLVNKVRFKIGYADSAERPVPMLGEDLKNPIYMSLKSAEVRA